MPAWVLPTPGICVRCGVLSSAVMRVGAVYPQVELAGDPDAVRVIGDALEGIGYDHLLAFDHVLGALHASREPPLTGPYTEQDPFHEPFVLFAYLAGRTTTLEFVPGVLVLPQRQTALVAKQVADLAVLSGNRVRLGIGTGWNWVEYEALGVPYRRRGARMNEQIEVLRALWSAEVVDFDGEFHRIDRANILPRPTVLPQVWIGGHSEPPLRRAAALGDGFLFSGPGADCAEQWALLRRLLSERGRPIDGFGAQRVIRSTKGPVEAAARAKAWAELGGTHVAFVTMGLGLDSAEAHVDYFAQVTEALDRG